MNRKILLWARSTTNPFVDEDYDQRLLVLTAANSIESSKADFQNKTNRTDI